MATDHQRMTCFDNPPPEKEKILADMNITTSDTYRKRKRLTYANMQTHDDGPKLAAAFELAFKDISHAYIDVGDCDCVCEHCNATFWYEERLKGSFQDGKTHYHRCCGGGKVVLPTEYDPPDGIKELFRNKHFLENIRAYNQMFSMTSFGAHIDDSINDKGPYVFKISGQIYHWIGALCPLDDGPPRFLQLYIYIYDTENEVSNRMRHFGRKDCSKLCPDIVKKLINLLNAHNGLVKLFRTARDKCKENEVPPFTIRLYNVVGLRQYELPTSETLGAIVFENGKKTRNDYDVIIQLKDGMPQRINKLHPS